MGCIFSNPSRSSPSPTRNPRIVDVPPSFRTTSIHSPSSLEEDYSLVLPVHEGYDVPEELQHPFGQGNVVVLNIYPESIIVEIHDFPRALPQDDDESGRGDEDQD